MNAEQFERESAAFEVALQKREGPRGDTPGYPGEPPFHWDQRGAAWWGWQARAQQQAASAEPAQIGYIKIGLDGCPRAQLTTAFVSPGVVWPDNTAIYAAPAAAHAQQPVSGADGVPHAIEQMAINRYRPVPSGAIAYKVVAGDGSRSLFSGTKDECHIVARKLTEAFLDGAHVALQERTTQPQSSGDAGEFKTDDQLGGLLAAIQNYGSWKYAEAKGRTEPDLSDVRAAWDEVYEKVQALAAHASPTVAGEAQDWPTPAQEAEAARQWDAWAHEMNQCRDASLEQAARICDAEGQEWDSDAVAKHCARSIRALKGSAAARASGQALAAPSDDDLIALAKRHAYDHQDGEAGEQEMFSFRVNHLERFAAALLARHGAQPAEEHASLLRRWQEFWRGLVSSDGLELYRDTSDALFGAQPAASAAPVQSEATLYAHDDGRYAVSHEAPAPFSHNEPKWHRVGPVSVRAPAAPQTWYSGSPPFPQDQEWFIAETTFGDRVVLRSLDVGRERKGNYAFTTADGTYLKAELVKRWMQFPDCMYLPPTAPADVMADAKRIDWLCNQFVTVRIPLRYGSKECFMGSPDDDDGEYVPWDIRKAIDAARAKEGWT